MLLVAEIGINHDGKISLAKQLVDAGHLLGIKVYDHIILAGGTYVSLADQGLL
jgi:DNA repair protein RadC